MKANAKEQLKDGLARPSARRKSESASVRRRVGCGQGLKGLRATAREM